MKYIDAEKLIESLEKIKQAEYENCGETGLFQEVQELIDSLRQEQPMPDSTKLIELWHEDKEMLKEKDFRDDPWRLAYNAFMCGFGRGIAVNKQEQPEVDLEKEIQEHIKECLDVKFPTTDIELIKKDVAYTARKFYELGINARKEKNKNVKE